MYEAVGRERPAWIGKASSWLDKATTQPMRAATPVVAGPQVQQSFLARYKAALAIGGLALAATFVVWRLK